MSDRVRSSEPGGSSARPSANGQPATRGQSAKAQPAKAQPAKAQPIKDQPAAKGRQTATKSQPSAGRPTRGPGTSSGRRPTVGRQPMTKNDKRAAAKAAKEAARAAAVARRRRMQWLSAGLAVVVLAALVIVGYLVFGRSGSKHPAAAAQPSACASSSPAPAAAASAMPSLPPGTDPALATEPTVTCGTGTLSSLKVTTLIQGTGPAVQSGQTITANYVGVSYQTGQEFDASWKDGGPTDLTIAQGQVIDGWVQGLVGVKVGSRVQLDIPSNLAYGDNPQAGSPSGPLRFVVDVLAIK